MKKTMLLLTILMVLQTITKAQQENQFIAEKLKSNAVPSPAKSSYAFVSYKNGPEKDADIFLRRSRNQRIVGWSTLGGGILLSGIGILVANGDYATNNNNASLAAVLTIAGAVSGIVSIPFMIMASANRHKAHVLLNNTKTGFGVPPGVSNHITGITISLPIGK